MLVINRPINGFGDGKIVSNMRIDFTLKRLFKNFLSGLIALLGKTKIGRYLFQAFLEQAMSETDAMRRDGLEFHFAVANPLLKLRSQTLFNKEPETLEWIDRMASGAVLWDIGANVGTYSIYAAVARKANVYAFEPSVFNLEFLARNIKLNEVAQRITILPIALSNRNQVNEMRLTSTIWGGALSTFGETYDGNGDPIQQSFGYKIPGLTMDTVKDVFQIPQPDFLKIDVDGIEALILDGGKNILAKTNSILIEINDDFKDQAQNSERLLKQQGFFLKEKRRSEFEQSGDANQFVTFNQIWARD